MEEGEERTEREGDWCSGRVFTSPNTACDEASAAGGVVGIVVCEYRRLFLALNRSCLTSVEAGQKFPVCVRLHGPVWFSFELKYHLVGGGEVNMETIQH